MSPLYDLRCPECGSVQERYAPISVGKSSTSCSCGGTLKRIYTPPAVPKTWEPHFNHSVGEYVRNRTEFNDALRRAEDRQFAATGVEGSFVPIESGDHSSENDLHETHRRARQAGAEPRTKSYFA